MNKKSYKGGEKMLKRLEKRLESNREFYKSILRDVWTTIATATSNQENIEILKKQFLGFIVEITLMEEGFPNLTAEESKEFIEKALKIANDIIKEVEYEKASSTSS